MMYRKIKAYLDTLIAFFVLVILSPLIFILSLFIRLDGQGKAIFKQARVGKGGEIFYMYKLRTMRSTEVSFNVNRAVIDDDNANLTRIGRFLRKYKIDELPQLFNVLIGDMSIVGPRPLMPVYLDNYHGWERAKFAEKPGMTGYAQVNGNGYLSRKERSYYDVFYSKNLNFWLDIKIIFLTIKVIIKGENACTKRVDENIIRDFLRENDDVNA